MSPWENFFTSRRARSRSPIIMSTLFHRDIMPARGKVDISVTHCNRKSMANVTNSGVPRSGPQALVEKEPLTPAETEKAMVRRVQQGDVNAYEELVRKHQHRILSVVGRLLRGT